MNTGQINDALLSDAEKHRSAERLGRALCQRFGLDPARFSSAYLVGCAMDVATLVGQFYMFGAAQPIPTTDDERRAVRLFQETHMQQVGMQSMTEETPHG